MVVETVNDTVRVFQTNINKGLIVLVGKCLLAASAKECHTLMLVAASVGKSSFE